MRHDPPRHSRGHRWARLVRQGLAAALTLLPCHHLAAQVREVARLTTREIAALDRARTVVVLTGGMLEEHGPYLPAFTDGILSARLTEELAAGIARERPGWTVLVFPPLAAGASGSNEIGGLYRFPGTYAIRPSTLRATFVDLATELGEQGFRRILVVHVHGAPLHIGAIDDAGDFFHDTYGGFMVNLWGLLPVLGGWGGAMADMTAAEKQADGVSLHAGMDEHSLMLYLRPDLVSPDFRKAPVVSGTSYEADFAKARAPGWPGYLGAPHLGNAALGEKIWRAFSRAALTTAVEILDGRDPASYPRYVTYLKRQTPYQAWIDSSNARDARAADQLRRWLDRRPP